MLRAIETWVDFDTAQVTIQKKVIIHKFITEDLGIVEDENGNLYKTRIRNLAIEDPSDSEWLLGKHVEPSMHATGSPEWLQDYVDTEDLDLEQPFMMVKIFKDCGKLALFTIQNLNSEDALLITEGKGFKLLKKIRENKWDVRYLCTTGFSGKFLYILEGYNVEGCFIYAFDNRNTEEP